MQIQKLGGPSPSHGFKPKIFEGLHDCDKGLTRKEIKEIEDNPEYSITKEDQAIRISLSM